MGLELITQSRKFFSQLKNGESYSLLTGDFATHLKGSVMERILMRYLVDIQWFSAASASSPFTFVGTNTVTRPSGSFIRDGFSVGDTCDFFDPDGVPVAGNPRTVLVLEDLTMIVDGIVFGTTVADDVVIRGSTPLTGYEHAFGIIEQDEAFNFESKLDGSSQIWTAKDVGAGGPRSILFVIGDTKGQVIGWASGSMQVRYVSNPSTFVQRFEIEHEFIILPYYLAGDEDDILAGIQPALLAGDNTLRYALQMKFLNVLSNPNTAKTFRDDQSLGSVGGFGENFNGFNDKFSIASIEYEEIATALEVDGVIVDSDTKVTVVVDSVDGVFDGSSIFGVYHSFLPTEPQYADQTNLFEDVWLYDNKIQTIGAGAISGTIVKTVTGTLINPNRISIEFTVSFSPSQQAQLDNGDLYALGIQVADSTLDSDATDKVILLGDLRGYIKDTDIPGLVSLTDLVFYDHPQATETGPGASNYTDFKGWPEDGINCSFNLVRDLNEDAEIKRVAVSLAAYNPTTKESFLLDEFPIPLGETFFTPDSPNDIQQINVSIDRGYSLKADDFFNKVELNTAARVADDQFYLARVGMKIRWETWINQPDADTVFFDNSLENNGLNKKASQYSLKEGYEIRVFIDVTMDQGGVETIYRFSSTGFDIRDYDLDAFITPEWVSTIRTFTPAGDEITPTVLTDDFTIMEVTHVRGFGPVTAPQLADFYAIHRIEEDNAQGQVIEELSSITDRRPVDGSKLVGLVGETRTKISLVGGNAVTECRVDPESLDASKSYKLSARLGSLTNTPLPVSGGKLKEDGDMKNKEDGDNKEKE